MNKSLIQKERPVLAQTFTGWEYANALNCCPLAAGQLVEEALQHDLIERVPGQINRFRYRQQPILPQSLTDRR